ncbi:MAG: hypothetical protein ACQETH_01455 [Candidatus Rifleibacteriota bacterium]
MTMKNPLFNRWQIIVILFLVSLGLARAAFKEDNLLLSCRIDERENSCSVFIGANNSLNQVVSFNAVDASLTIDFKGSGLDKKLLNNAFANDLISMGYFFSYPEGGKIGGLKLFLNGSVLKSIKKGDDAIELIIEKNSNHSGKTVFNSESLMNPERGKHSPVVLKFKEVSVLPLILNLAERAGISLSFSGKLPETIAVDMSVTNPLDGLKQIAADINARLLKSDNHYWLVGAEDES